MESAVIAPANLSRIAIPPLENGGLLSRAEFERRYTAMPGLKKAELIEGIVYMVSPLRFEPHAEPHARLITCIGFYVAFTPHTRIGDNPTARLDVDNEAQPDAVLLINAQRGGQTCLSDDGYIVGAPEFIAEIAASTATIDLRDKKRVYRRSMVKEYLVWQVIDRRIDWFSLQEGRRIYFSEPRCRWNYPQPSFSGAVAGSFSTFRWGYAKCDRYPPNRVK